MHRIYRRHPVYQFVYVSIREPIARASTHAGERDLVEVDMAEDLEVADLLEGGPVAELVAVVAVDGDQELVVLALEHQLEVLAVVEGHRAVHFFGAPRAVQLRVSDHAVHVESRVEVQGVRAVVGLEVDGKAKGIRKVKRRTFRVGGSDSDIRPLWV